MEKELNNYLTLNDKLKNGIAFANKEYKKANNNMQIEYECGIIIKKSNDSEITKEEIIKYTIATLFSKLNSNNDGSNYEIKSLIRNELRKYKNNN